MKVTEDEYKEWLEHPVTKWIFEGIDQFAATQKGRWANAAWDAGTIDERLLDKARISVDCFSALKDSNYNDWMAIHDSEA